MPTDYGYQGSITTSGSERLQPLLTIGGTRSSFPLVGALTVMIQTLYTDINPNPAGGVTSKLDALFAAQGFPKTFNGLVIMIRKQAYQDAGIPEVASQLDPSTFFSSPIVTSFRDSVITLIASKEGTNRDYYTQTATSSSQPQVPLTDDEFVRKFFDSFAASFVYDPRAYTLRTTALLNEFAKYGQPYVSVNVPTELVGGTIDSDFSALYANFNSYEAFFNSFKIPGDTASSFKTLFDNFSQSFINQKGFFDPTLAYDKWTEAIVKRYVQSFTGGASNVLTTVSDTLVNGQHKTAVLNRIFKLIVLMIQSLQNVTAAQADRLRFLANWQSAYTDLQSQIKYALKSGGNPSITDDNDRAAFNAKNANFVEILKARKSIVSDDSKNLQTNVSQSNDAVNQQVSMGPSILQELSSILQSIYK